MSTVENTEHHIDLNKFLQSRPDPQTLVERNILKDPKIAPALQQQAEDLKRARLESTLAHKIENRPTAQDLIDHHILLDTSVAPALQGKEAELKRQQLADQLAHKIQERPAPEELVERHILPGNVE
ncbi:hypothetical protein DFQ27_008650 [Actinomortierella ambigua]|uniref:RPEL repeat protein n=1 Tax=Actinomortierella ambigua TaxID=1343610 RepID=A0A9P6TY38_9FUNG|nr:hypothetical protein DFQ27_008650 [Actinomortierella ambigua]